MEIDVEQPHEVDGQFIRVIVADTQAIFRAGLRKIFALEDDIRVVGQSETLGQTLSAAKKFTADILIFESALAQNPVEAVSDLIRQTPNLRIVVVTPESNQELTLELLRRGAHGIVSRDVEPELLVDCCAKFRKATPGSIAAGRSGCSKPTAPRAHAPVSEDQGAADSEGIAHRLLRDPGDEEQGNRAARWHHRTGREELPAQGLRQAGCSGPPRAGFVLLHNRVLDGGVKVPAAPVPSSGNGSAQELAPQARKPLPSLPDYSLSSFRSRRVLVAELRFPHHGP